LKNEEEVKKSLAEKKGLEERLIDAEKSKQKDALAAQQLKDIEAERKAAEAKLQEEAAKRRALERELEKLQAEQKKSAQAVDTMPGKSGKEERFASVPKDFTGGAIQRVSLRSSPRELWDEDINKMIAKYNFFNGHENVHGEFPNDFEYHGDGTITDRTTGLMWQKGGSSTALTWPGAEKYVSQLNKERQLGYNDWRVPTLEELWTLLKPEKNKNGLHIDGIFDRQQKNVWSADWITQGYYSARQMYVVEFDPGRIITKESGIALTAIMTRASEKGFIRAVRTVRGTRIQKQGAQKGN